MQADTMNGCQIVQQLDSSTCDCKSAKNLCNQCQSRPNASNMNNGQASQASRQSQQCVAKSSGKENHLKSTPGSPSALMQVSGQIGQTKPPSPSHPSASPVHPDPDCSRPEPEALAPPNSHQPHQSKDANNKPVNLHSKNDQSHLTTKDDQTDLTTTDDSGQETSSQEMPEEDGNRSRLQPDPEEHPQFQVLPHEPEHLQLGVLVVGTVQVKKVK